MEVFASIAIATQHAEPSLSAGKRACDASHVISRGKRARTDSSSCQRLGPTSLQPATSYGQSYETCLEEAELLLHFAHQARDTQLSQFDGPDVLRLQHTLYNLAAVLQPEEHAAGRNGPGNNQSSPVQPMGEDIQEQRKPSKDILDPSIGHSINGPIEETELSPFLSLAEAPHVPTVAGVHTESVLQKILHGTKERDRDTDTTVFYERRQASNEISGLTQTHEAGPSLMLNTPQDNREESPDYNARQHHVLEIPQPSRVDAAHEIISLDGEALPSLEHISNGRDSALEMSYDASQTHADSPKYEAQDAMPVSSPTQVNANGLNSSDAVSTSHAVCAACRFSKNSLSIDSEGNATSWINCDGCKSWFHFACAGFKNEREVRSIDKYRCKKCKPIHGATSYVRKSARAHSAIDYAGLHQGVIKTSDDRPEHHYIQPIKNGTISFLPENFPRMRPELVTSEYFEKGSGMKEPVVIPASINPRPYVSELKEPTLSDLHQSSTYCGIDDSANLEEWLNQDSEACRIPDDGQDDLDMVMPRGLTVRKVAELYGSEEKIEVIDVKSQNGEGRKWNMRRWVDYYENADENKTIRNVISLEVSQSLLGKLIRRPQIVRDLDLQDAVWPEDLLAKGEYPHVQFYCLMSVADCFTDFHIDFGGSSVFYHILKGKKTFLFIPPKEKHLKRYEEWCMSPAQNWTFLPDQTHECYRVDLSEGDTMLIPSGWIHAVWTPEDSLVIGGNFLTRLNYGMQLRIAQVEKNTGVARKFRYPHFQKLHWFTVLQYVEDDPLPSKVREQLESGSTFRRETSSSDQFNEWGENSKISPENFHARYYSQAELEGLPDLLRYVLRTVLIENGTITEGITAETRNAVRKSIPRGHGEPMEVIKTFAIWCAWKRGNEPILHWAYPNAIVEAAASDKLSLAASKKLAEEAALKAPRRQSRRMQAQKEANKTINAEADGNAAVEDLPSHEVEATEVRRPFELLQEPGTTDESFSPFKKQRIMNGSNTQRKTACDSCRRRRRACKHKGVVEPVIADGQHETAPSKKVHKEAFLNGNALQEKLSSIGGLFNSLTAKSETHQSSTPASLVPQESSLTFAAADHTLEHSPAALGAVNPALPAPQQNRIDETAPPENGSPSRPRTKACNHCRKSKVCNSVLHRKTHALILEYSDAVFMMPSVMRTRSKLQKAQFPDLMPGKRIEQKHPLGSILSSLE